MTQHNTNYPTDTLTGAAKDVADSLIKSYYNDAGKPGSVPGILPDPYYWWESGAVYDGLVNYWQLTGDDAHNAFVQEGLVWQLGSDDDYMPVNQTRTIGNDDQMSWALAAMSAAERGFPTKEGAPSWGRVAANVFDEQAQRWDDKTCGGGLRWQIYPFNNGYTYKNSIAQGLFFQLAARLARFSGNQTYADWAEKAYVWTQQIGLIDQTNHVLDGADVAKNCSANSIEKTEWSNSAAAFLYGAAVMSNFTNNTSPWRSRTEKHLTSLTNVFFSPSNATSILKEASCDTTADCTTDARAYKALALRWLAQTALMAPWTADDISDRLRRTAAAAAARCSQLRGGGLWECESLHVPGDTGLGEQLVALDAIQALLVSDAAPLAAANATGNGTATRAGGANGTAAAEASARPS
ncbi:glycoside hydrolase family 76 protein, partial [Aplosporella prunicola CBS 121167]